MRFDKQQDQRVTEYLRRLIGGCYRWKNSPKLTYTFYNCIQYMQIYSHVCLLQCLINTILVFQSQIRWKPNIVLVSAAESHHPCNIRLIKAVTNMILVFQPQSFSIHLHGMRITQVTNIILLYQHQSLAIYKMTQI